jgi:hypothetical protein
VDGVMDGDGAGGGGGMQQVQLVAQLEGAATQLHSVYGCEVGAIIFDDRGRLRQCAPGSDSNELAPVLQRWSQST